MAYLSYFPERQLTAPYLAGPSGLGDGDGWDAWDWAHGAFDLVSLGVLIFAGIVIWHSLTKAGPATKRRSAIAKAKADLKAARSMSRWF